jgi:hypothetical protein
MLITPLTKKAMQIVLSEQKGIVDIDGYPYIYNALHIAEKMKTEDGVVVALLYGIKNDEKVSTDNLRRYGFS